MQFAYLYTIINMIYYSAPQTWKMLKLQFHLHIALCFKEFSSWKVKFGNVCTQVWLSSLYVQECLQGWALCKQLEYGNCSPENHDSQT